MARDPKLDEYLEEKYPDHEEDADDSFGYPWESGYYGDDPFNRDEED